MVSCNLQSKKRRLVLVATTLLAALEQDKGELPTKKLEETVDTVPVWTRQSWLPTTLLAALEQDKGELPAKEN